MYQEKIRVVENEIAKKEEEILSVKHRIEDLQLAKEQAQRRLSASVNEASKESKLRIYTKENERLKKAEDELVAEEKILEILTDDLKQLQIQKTEYEKAEKEHEKKKNLEEAQKTFLEYQSKVIELAKMLRKIKDLGGIKEKKATKRVRDYLNSFSMIKNPDKGEMRLVRDCLHMVSNYIEGI